MGLYKIILEYAFGSVLLGTLAAIFFVVVLIIGVQAWRTDKQMSPLSWIITLFMFLFVCFHTTLFTGAVKLKSWGAEKQDVVNRIMHVVPDNHVFTQEDSDEIFVVFHTYLNHYMLRRTLWTLFFAAVGTTGIIYFMEHRKRSTKGSSHSRLRMYED